MEALISLAKDFLDIDWRYVEFNDVDTSVKIGIGLIVLLAIKVFLSRNRGRAGSGYFISKSLKHGLFFRAAHLLPGLLIAIGIFFLLFAFADPFTSRSSEKIIVESRERVEVLDVSASMGYRDRNSRNECLAEIVRRQHLKFLAMRRGLHDRVGLWLFTDIPLPLEGFIHDDELYMLQVKNAPYIVLGKRHFILKDSEFIAPKDRLHYIFNMGGTNISKALRAAIDFLENEGDFRIRQKTILIMTDGASQAFPLKELREIKRKGIALYLLFIKPAPKMFEDAKNNRVRLMELQNSEKFVAQIRNFGGKYFEVDSEEGLAMAFKAIHEMEAKRTEVVKRGVQVHIYDRPLAFGIIFMIVGVILALMLEIRWPIRP